MAPERFSDWIVPFRIIGPSKQSDVYSLAMTSFEVRSTFVSPYELSQPPRYDQVLTGIPPYDSNSRYTIPDRVVNGERPSRPINPFRNRWFRGPVWGVITTGWNHEPEQRCGLSVMHRAFLTSSQQEVRNVKLGDINTQQQKPRAD